MQYVGPTIFPSNQTYELVNMFFPSFYTKKIIRRDYFNMPLSKG